MLEVERGITLGEDGGKRQPNGGRTTRRNADLVSNGGEKKTGLQEKNGGMSSVLGNPHERAG